MRFAALGGSNAGNYAQAGKAVADSAARTHAIQRKTGPNYGDLSKVAMKTNAEEKIAGIQASAKVAATGINAYSNVTQMGQKVAVVNDKIDRFKKGKMAGSIAAIGKIAGAGFLAATDNTKGRERPKADFSSINEGYKTKRDALLSNYNNNSTSNTDTTTSTTKKVDGGATQSTTNPLGSSLTGNQKTVADAIAKYESGDWGYEAFNQGGAAGGTKVLGKSGSYKQTYGSSLTDMTLGQIYHKQNTKQRGLSMKEHLESGGLHAVGRYQFIGSTLQDEARRMGLSDDTKFTPEVQDNIFLNHIKRVGNISPWVGPSNNYSSGQKQEFNSMIAGF